MSKIYLGKKSYKILGTRGASVPSPFKPCKTKEFFVSHKYIVNKYTAHKQMIGKHHLSLSPRTIFTIKAITLALLNRFSFAYYVNKFKMKYVKVWHVI